MSYETVESKTVFKGKILDVVQDIIILPDGKRAMREVVVHGEAAAILPVAEDGRLIFVRQYRHGSRSMMLEIPAGVCNDGEDPFGCASRELEEETGYKSSNITKLCHMYTSMGFCTEIIHLYIAKNLEQGKQNFDEDEFITLETYTLDEAKKMIYDGSISDGKTIAAIFGYGDTLANNDTFA